MLSQAVARLWPGVMCSALTTFGHCALRVVTLFCLRNHHQAFVRANTRYQRLQHRTRLTYLSASPRHGAQPGSSASPIAIPHAVPSLQIAEQAREAATKSQQLAAEHWDVTCKAQTMVQRAVDLADDASVKAQQARSRAMVLSHKLDVMVQRHVGEAGWPMSEESEKPAQ
jgi:hypothetical protein